MFDINQIALLVLIALGATVQTVTGFAMGLIIMGGAGVLGLASISDVAVLVSIISLVNTSLALRRSHRKVDYRLIGPIVLMMLPMVSVGVWLLNVIASSDQRLLKQLLGAVIILAGVLLTLSPRTYERMSGLTAKLVAGTTSGLMSGLYGAGGAPVAYLLYRQPVELAVVRASLLMLFTISTLGRSVMVTVRGEMTQSVLMLAAIAVPLVIVVTESTLRVHHHLPDALIRRGVFILLIIMGVFLIVSP